VSESEQAEIEQLRARVAELEAQNAYLEFRLTTADEILTDERAGADGMRARIAELEEARDELRNTRDRVRTDLGDRGDAYSEVRQLQLRAEARLTAVIALAEEHDDYLTFSDILRAAQGHDPRNE